MSRVQSRGDWWCVRATGIRRNGLWRLRSTTVGRQMSGSSAQIRGRRRSHVGLLFQVCLSAVHVKIWIGKSCGCVRFISDRRTALALRCLVRSCINWSEIKCGHNLLPDRVNAGELDESSRLWAGTNGRSGMKYSLPNFDRDVIQEITETSGQEVAFQVAKSNPSIFFSSSLFSNLLSGAVKLLQFLNPINLAVWLSGDFQAPRQNLDKRHFKFLELTSSYVIFYDQNQ